ncbi:DNA topoisomerase 1 beta-like [Papaver somniferum]|uniref:DNA topoisomerase 1 beta-like n=1 Tax=Papaver somniferum TaxID=3469 RepID=UPI000E6FD72B|nr:DNA topoisomerase 1 beta-like [Papaver somniferum]
MTKTTTTSDSSGMVPPVLPSGSNNKSKQFSDSRFRYIGEENSKLMNEDKMNLTSLFQLRRPSSNVDSKHEYDSKMMTTTTSDSGMVVSPSVLPSGSNKSKQSQVGGDSRFPYTVEENSKLMDEDKMNLTSLFQLPSSSDSIKQVSETANTDDQDDEEDNLTLIERKEKLEEDNLTLAERKEKLEAASALGRISKTKIAAKKVTSSSLKCASKKIIKSRSKSTNLHLNSGAGKKWTTFAHNGIVLPPPYKPHGVKMLYNGEQVELTPEQEEVATMFAVMKDTEFAAKPKFIENFMNDWRVILGKEHVIKKFHLCDFTPIYDWHQNEKDKKKQLSALERKALKEEKLKEDERYMWAFVDGKKEKVGNFRVEPPGLFRGRGEHPKMGKLKRRIRPDEITINIGKGEPVPECPIPNERWKEVKHDNTVTWLAFWKNPIDPKAFKYVFLDDTSSWKGQSDKDKYEKARLLKDYILDIRANYRKDFRNKDLMKQQISVAAYLIDMLALRAGNEKDDDEADTVGCCTLKVENVSLVPQTNKLEINFLGKDSIKYENTVEVDPLVYKAIGEFKKGKNTGEELFDKLDTYKLNAHLKELMPGLTAKVFRTYNASITLDKLLNSEIMNRNVAEKVVVYNRANKEVAKLCNHQRSEPKSHGAQMLKLRDNIVKLKGVLDGLETNLHRVRKGKAPLQLDADDGKPKKNFTPEILQRKIKLTLDKIEKTERDMDLKKELKTTALGTSKTNYLDPRISVAWCKRHEVPIEKIFNKSLLAKFAWAMDVDPSFRF